MENRHHAYMFIQIACTYPCLQLKIAVRGEPTVDLVDSVGADAAPSKSASNSKVSLHEYPGFAFHPAVQRA